MPWTREEKIFCITTYLDNKIIQNCKQNFAGSLTFIPRKAKFIVGYIDFKPQGY